MYYWSVDLLQFGNNGNKEREKLSAMWFPISGIVTLIYMQNSVYKCDDNYYSEIIVPEPYTP